MNLLQPNIWKNISIYQTQKYIDISDVYIFAIPRTYWLNIETNSTRLTFSPQLKIVYNARCFLQPVRMYKYSGK